MLWKGSLGVDKFGPNPPGRDGNGVRNPPTLDGHGVHHSSYIHQNLFFKVFATYVRQLRAYGSRKQLQQKTMFIVLSYAAVFALAHES
jgi:hypothetical protein